MGVGPGGDTQGRGSVDDDVGGATGLDDGGVVDNLIALTGPPVDRINVNRPLTAGVDFNVSF